MERKIRTKMQSNKNNCATICTYQKLCVSLPKNNIMIYGYIRVSSDKQTVENQRFEIERFCEHQQLQVDGWIEETITGTRAYTKRRLGKLLRQVKDGDLIICSELSRLGRSLYMIMEILGLCMRKGCRVWTIKEGYRLGDDIQSKVLAFAFGLSAEIERELISQRTKEALARVRAEGQSLGRPRGKHSSKEHYKLTRHDNYIRRAYEAGISVYAIAQHVHSSPNTVKRYLERFVFGDN